MSPCVIGSTRPLRGRDLTFIAGRRCAVTGPIGAGEVHVMILTGEIRPTKGSITRRRDRHCTPGRFSSDQFPRDRHHDHRKHIAVEALRERDALYARPIQKVTDADGMRLGELEGIVGGGQLRAEADTRTLLDGLGVESWLHQRKMGELQSGQEGWRARAERFSGVLTALLLDEPTPSDLDLESRALAQGYLRSGRCSSSFPTIHF